MILRAAALCFFLSLPVGAAAAPSDNADVAVPPADRDRVLAIGDQVTLQILEDRDEPASRRVTDIGDLDVPYIGRIRASGRTTTQVAAEIKRLLEKDYYHTATVKLGIDQVNKAAAMGRIYVSGRVQKEGPIEFYKGDKLTVSQAILRAGGFHQFADTRSVRVTRQNGRGNTETFKVDVKSVLERGRLEEDMVVRDQDQIFVPQRLINF